MKLFIVYICIFFVSDLAQAESRKPAKVQKINFDGQDVDGKVRQPDGSYIVQKRGIEFIPLYKLKENFDEQVEDSLEYLK